MKIKTITREKICEALQTEPLAAGQWAQGWNTEPLKTDCAVCAIGAVMRTVLRNGALPTAMEIRMTAERNIDWGSAFCSSKGVESALAGKAYFNALSCVFEGALHVNKYPFASTKRDVTQQDRNDFCAFVNEHFPPVLEIEVPS